MKSETRPDAIPLQPPARPAARVAFWLLAFVAPFLLIATLDYTLARHNRPLPSPIATATFQLSDAATPSEVPASGWQPVRLPHSSARPPAGERASAWFRLRFDAGALPAGLWGVYLPRPYANVAVFVNGEFIGDGGPMAAPLPLHRNPLRFNFPAKLLHPGENELQVRSVVITNAAGLGRIYVAPDELLEPAYRFARLMFVTLKQVTVVTMYLGALVMAAMYFMRRRDAAFGWFALALVMWATHIEIMLIPRAPFDPRSLWETLQGIAIGLYSICAAVFVHRFLGVVRPRLEKLLFAWGAFGTLVLLSGPLLVQRPLYTFFGLVWIPVAQWIGIYQLVALLLSNHRRPDPEVRMLAAASWLVIVVGVRDGLVDGGILSRGYLYLTYTAVPVLVVFGAILLRRFVNALDASERANEVLEARVAETSRELTQHLGRLKDMEKERALSAERERIMQDMHDGIGGNLVQALSIAASRADLAPIEEPLRNCLEELRILIDSIEPVNGDLGSVLGTLRMRMSRRLAQAGVEMRWQVGDLPTLPDLGPKDVLEITRIVQEAITNSLKHSGARRIGVAAHAETRGTELEIIVEVSDDGGGFRARQDEGTGRGIVGMKRRAATLGGQLHIAADATGTTVRLEIPAKRPPSKAPAAGQALEYGSASGVSAAHSGSTD